jgi:hypothetical protein
MSEGNKLSESSNLWDWIFKVTQLAVPVFIAVATVVIVPWCRGIESRLYEMAKDDQSMNGRVIRLESFANQGERFTASDANSMKLELQNAWLKEVSEIRRQIDTLPQTLQMPPVWWEQYVKSEIRRLEQRLDSHETKDFK